MRDFSNPFSFGLTDPPAGGSAPVIQSSDKTRKIEVRELETSELPCVADGYPFPTYNWKKDGKPIVIDNFRLSQNGGNLIINTTRVSDSGLYICTATNDHGKVSASTNVTVTGGFFLSLFFYPHTKGFFRLKMKGRVLVKYPSVKPVCCLGSDVIWKGLNSAIIILPAYTEYIQHIYDPLLSLQFIDQT